MKNGVVLGFAPCVSHDVQRQDALLWKEQLKNTIRNFGAVLADLDDITADGLILDQKDAAAAAAAFEQAGVDGVFYPVFGEDQGNLVPNMAKKLSVPTLLYGGRADLGGAEAFPMAHAIGGVYDTAKMLQRQNIPFSYIPVSRCGEPVFEKNFRNFACACAVKASMQNLRVLQIGTHDNKRRMFAVNENALLQKFGVEIVTITLTQLIEEINAIFYKQGADWAATMAMIMRKMDCSHLPEDVPGKLSAMKLALTRLCEEYNCGAAAICCRDDMQKALYLYPCAVAGLLTDEGLPVACDTDIHGAISAVLLQTAARAANPMTSPVFYARMGVRHPEKDNAALLYSCGCAPVSLADAGETPILSDGPMQDAYPGCGQWRLKEGSLTLCRLDGENGDYRLFVGQAAACDGPKVRGTYTWMQTEALPIWEDRLLRGGYVPAFICVHANVAPILREACRFIDGLVYDGVLPTAAQVDGWLLQNN